MRLALVPQIQHLERCQHAALKAVGAEALDGAYGERAPPLADEGDYAEAGQLVEVSEDGEEQIGGQVADEARRRSGRRCV